MKKAFYQTISDEAMMAILALRQDGSCLYANRMAKDLLEFPLDFNAETFRVEQIFPNTTISDRIRQLSVQTLEMQGLAQEILVKKLNQQNFVASVGIKHIQIGNENAVLLMLQDVSWQKKLQREVLEKQNMIDQTYQELLEQNKQLKNLDVAKNRFIAVTTHELRTPLSAIFASAELLKLKLYDTPIQHDEFLNMIYDQSEHLLNLVNDILDFAKIQAGKMDYYIEEKELASIVQLEMDSLQSMADLAGVKLTFTNSNEDSKCFFDEVRIRQVILNILNNAIKFNRKTGAVEVTITESSDFVFLSVKDTGKGIAREDHDKVFNEFETLGKSSNHSKGTGLGLPISRRMMESMGGALKLKSELGAGSTFWIEIPKKRVLSDENYRTRKDTGDLAA